MIIPYNHKEGFCFGAVTGSVTMNNITNRKLPDNIPVIGEIAVVTPP